MSFELSVPSRPLGKTVVLGYYDVGAAGIRALQGLSAIESGLTETGRERLTFSEMGGPVFEGLPAFEAVHFKGTQNGGRLETVTLLKLNTVIDERLSAALAMSLVDTLARQGPALAQFIVTAAVQSPRWTSQAKIPPSTSAGTKLLSGKVCVFSSGMDAIPDSIADLEKVPMKARIADRFLTTLVQFCRLQELPLVLLARSGYKTRGTEPTVDGTDEAISDLGRCLASLLHMTFDVERSLSMRMAKGSRSVVPSRAPVPGYM